MMMLDFMIEHPHRQKLGEIDLYRIQEFIDGKISEYSLSNEELSAAYDVLFDMKASEVQTHPGILILQ